MKKYKAIFFDWDGTAVKSRKAPVNHVVPLMIRLLEADIKLIIISGTTYDKIANGELDKMIPSKLLKNMYLGLGRGAHNYGFSDEGERIMLHEVIPTPNDLVKIHEVCFELHKYLLINHNIPTDIVFSRPNYCKIDLMVNHDRGEQLYLKQSELEIIDAFLSDHRIPGGINQLIKKSEEISLKFGIELKPTSDAKFIEVGLTTKADNIFYFVHNVIFPAGVSIKDCVFWGDEFGYIMDGVKGNDAEMIIPEVQKADFFDVNEAPMDMPKQVMALGGGVNTFLEFLKSQTYLNNLQTN